jgi:hypothetical protein
VILEATLSHLSGDVLCALQIRSMAREDGTHTPVVLDDEAHRVTILHARTANVEKAITPQPARTKSESIVDRLHLLITAHARLILSSLG